MKKFWRGFIELSPGWHLLIGAGIGVALGLLLDDILRPVIIWGIGY